MNKVQELLNGLSDAELKAALAEMRELDQTGVLPTGQVRNLALRLQHEAGLTANDARSIAQTGVFRVAAYRWAEF